MGPSITKCMKEIDELERHGRSRFIPVREDFVDPLLPNLNKNISDIFASKSTIRTKQDSYSSFQGSGHQISKKNAKQEESIRDAKGKGGDLAMTFLSQKAGRRKIKPAMQVLADSREFIEDVRCVNEKRRMAHLHSPLTKPSMRISVADEHALEKVLAEKQRKRRRSLYGGDDSSTDYGDDEPERQFVIQSSIASPV